MKDFWGRRQIRPLSPQARPLTESLLPRIAWNPSDLSLYPKCSLEIGFGNGEHLYQQALRNPETLWIGCEPFINGMVSLLKKMEEVFLPNVRVTPDPGQIILASLPDRSLDFFYLLFPDPWPKKRHHKRRFVQKATLHELSRVLKFDGEIRIASDHPSYQEWVKDHFGNGFISTRDDLFLRPYDWPPTRYECKAIDPCAYFIFRKL